MTVINKSNSLVYLVDDEFVMRDSLTLLIESTGLTVRSFESAPEFLDHYDSKQPSCLVLDVRMPTITGLELQEELVKRAIAIPIIFISGNADIPDSAKAFRAGAIDFLQKPFDHTVLLMRIQEALKKDHEFREKAIETATLQQRINRLTLREKEVLSLVVSYRSNKEIGKLLQVSNRTIDAHRANIMRKLHAESLPELVLMVRESDLLKDD
ncbi:MAG: response regulator transcription factor [Methylococcaceae bacterium]|nr:response regulator transcription factor [Methylococcaceae bacterium]